LHNDELFLYNFYFLPYAKGQEATLARISQYYYMSHL